MIDFLNPAGEPFAAQTQRLTARAQFGAADIFEIASVMRSIQAGDLEGWERAWMELAEAAEGEAQAAERAGHRASAIARYFHASSYYEQSDVFAKGADPKRKVAFAKSQAAFRKGAALHEPEIRVVAVPCGDEVYDGYLCLPAVPAGTRVPAVLFIGGADAYSEETYFSGRGMLDRGMAMLLLDLPGRGSSIYLKGIPTRADYEVPVAAAFDWLEAQPEIDPERLALAGISLAGYYAPRAAAFEKRAKALVAWGGIMNVIDDLYDFHPRLQGQLQWLTGTKDDASCRAKLREFDLTGIAKEIAIPTMIVHGRHDRISAVTGAEKLFLAVGATDKHLHIFDGPGAGHCSYDYWRHAVPLMFDWLRDRLG
jgi:dipeptidyl aminopeptidase/acylaminoacyl peptidase